MKMADRERERAVLESVPKDLYIGGEWRAATGDGTLPVEDPATGETLVEVADALLGDALAALTAAADKQAEWGAARSCAGPTRRSSPRPTSWRC
jgi:succinate-semialdehyde dehydrogenase / glutarate-semialdehyde dehydrogenase